MEIKDVKDKIKELEEKAARLDTKQKAIKLIINSFYGAFGNEYFYFYNPDLAGSITQQSKDLILFSLATVNYYFKEIWPTDYEIHKKLGIKPGAVKPIEEDASIYCDTDSTYANFHLMLKSAGLDQKPEREAVQACIDFIEYRFADYLNKAFDAYSAKFHTKNYQSFKLENISRRGIWVAKKMYAIQPVYNGEAEVFINEKKMITKGLVMAKPTWPSYARKKVGEVFDILMEKGQAVVHESDLLPKLRNFRKGFDKLEVEEIAVATSVRTYNDYISEGMDQKLELPGKCPFTVKASFHHNFLIEATNNRKYSKIRHGDKIKMYYVKDDRDDFYKQMDVFGYTPGEHPTEFAPKVDRDIQFFKTVIEPINKALSAMGLQEVSKDLHRGYKIYKPRTTKERPLEDFYPLYIFNLDTLDYEEVPKHLTKVFGTLSKPPATDKLEGAELFDYIDAVGKYGVNTCITPKYNLEKLIKKRKDDKEKERIQALDKDKLNAEYNELHDQQEQIRERVQNLESKYEELNDVYKSISSKKDDRDRKMAARDEKDNAKSLLKDAKDALKLVEKRSKWYVAAAQKLRKKMMAEAGDEIFDEFDVEV